MTCSLVIIADSPDNTELQLFDGCWSVLVNNAYPSPSLAGLSKLKSSSPTVILPSAAPWIYQPPGQPYPSIAINRLFQPLGGVNGDGAGSEVGSCRIAV